MYKVYDKQEKAWIKNNIFLSPDGELCEIKESFWGLVKTKMLLDLERYVYQRDVGLFDKHETLIYEGDFIQAQVDKDKTINGVVVFAPELAAYIILCDDTNEYFVLGTEVCKYIEVIGNVF